MQRIHQRLFRLSLCQAGPDHSLAQDDPHRLALERLFRAGNRVPLRIEHKRVTAVERSLRPQRAQTAGDLRQMAAPLFQFPRGMMRG